MQYAIYLLCDQLDEYGDDLGQEVQVLEVVEEEARATVDTIAVASYKRHAGFWIYCRFCPSRQNNQRTEQRKK